MRIPCLFRSSLAVLEVLESRVLLSGALQPQSDDLAYCSPLSISGTSSGEGIWLDLNLNDSTGSGAAPDLRVERSSLRGLSGHITVPGVWLGTVTLGNMPFARLGLPDTGSTSEIGKPELPVIRHMLSVPADATVSVRLMGAGESFFLNDLGLGGRLLPVQAPAVKSQSQPAALSFDTDCYAVDQLGPDARVRLTDAGYTAGQHMVLLEVLPVLYNPVREELHVYSDLAFEVSFADRQQVASAQPITLASTAELKPTGDATAAACHRLLVIAADSLVGAASLDSFADLKAKQGWAVDIVSTAAAGSTPEEIQAFIQDRYNVLSTRPAALLLVGDTGLVPQWRGVTQDNPDTDLYYATMDGPDDWQPEFPVGRFSVTDMAQLDVVVGKTIAYETAPAGTWMYKAAFLAGIDQHAVTENTHNSVIAQYMTPQGYSSDKLYAYSRDATTEQVTAAFNEGRVLGVYSGHGAVSAWADGPEYGPSEVNALTSVGMYPFIASFACITGQYSASECFAETWQRAENGAVAVLASSVDSFWTEDDILERKLFEAMIGERRLAFGEAVWRAKQLYLEWWGASNTTRRYYEMYNLFGDPTAQLVGQPLGIATSPTLQSAFVNESSSISLLATGGSAPYTWSIVAGQMPDGLQLSSNGMITGTPCSISTASFTAQVTDGSGAAAIRQFELSVVERLQSGTPSVLPDAAAGAPYDVSLELSGGRTPYSWSVVEPGVYTEESVSSGWIGGGTAMGWREDDSSWALRLPWAFPYYGAEYTSVNVSSNGFLDFRSSDDGFMSSHAGLRENARIAPLWTDLTTDEPGDDIFVTQTDDYVVVRWAAHGFGLATQGVPVNVEVVLHRNGEIAFNYSGTHDELLPVVGMSSGDRSHYTLSYLDGADTIPTGSLDFAYHLALPPGLSLDQATGRLSGVPTVPGWHGFTLRAADSSTPSQSITTFYSLTVLELPLMTVEAPDHMTEGDGGQLAAMKISIPAAVDSDLAVTLLSSDTSQARVPATVVIPAGQTSVTVDLTIIDDADLDWIRTVTITASAEGYGSGAAAIAVHDDESAELAVSLPASVRESDGILRGQGIVTVSRAPVRDVAVTLRSSDPQELVVPATVILRAGQTSAVFDLTLVDDGVIDGDQTVSVIAEVEEWTGASASTQILDSDRILTIAVPPKAREGDGMLSQMGIVTLGGTLASDITVVLASSDPSQLVVPAVVTVPAGRTSATFTLTIVDDAAYDGVQLVAVTGRAAEFPDAGAAISVADNEVHHFDFEPIPDQQVQGLSFAVTITARDINGAIIETYDGIFDLTGTGDHGPTELVIDGSEGDGQAELQPIKPILAAASKGLGTFHSYAELTTLLNDYAARNPSICQLYSLGKSIEGRDIWALKITDQPGEQENEPEFKYVSTIHGDEPVGMEMSLYLIDMLLSDYGSDERITSLVNSTEIWFVPLMNPDGLAANTRENAAGDDLNRSFPEGSPPNQIGTLFDGPAMDTSTVPPEVAAIMKWSAAGSFTLSAGLHGGSLVVNYPYDNDGLGSTYSAAPDDALFRHIAEIYASRNPSMWASRDFEHGISNGADWYAISGGMQDWNYRYLGTNEVTIELSDDRWLSEFQLPSIWSQNQESMLAYMEAVHLGVHGAVTDRLTGEPIHAAVQVAGNEHGVYTDPDVGDYHRMLLPGTYDLTFIAPGYAPMTVKNVVVTDSSPAHVDVTLVPEGVLAFHDGMWTGQVSVGSVESHVKLTVADDSGHAGESNTFEVLPPLAIITPEQLPPASASHAYSTVLQASGGIGPYTWSVAGTGGYAESERESQWIGGGTAMGWNEDDASWEVDLPWGFTFYGTTYNAIHVSSNGFIDLTGSSDGWGNSVIGLMSSVRIAALWDDLTTTDAGDDVFVTKTPGYVAIRWAAHTYDSFGNGFPANFEAVLYRDGNIGLNYQQIAGGLSATVGISHGNKVDYTLSGLNGASTIAGGTSVLFTNQVTLPPGLSLDASTGLLSGVPSAPGVYEFTLSVRDSHPQSDPLQCQYRLDVRTPSVVTGTAAADRFDFVLDESGQALRIYLNDPTLASQPYATYAAADLRLLTCNGLAGDDQFVVHLANGNPIPPDGLSINGDEGDNRISVLGAGWGAGSYIPDAAAAGSGTVTVGNRVISISGFTESGISQGSWPIHVDGLAEFAVLSGDSADSIVIDSISNGGTSVTGTAQSAAMGSVALFNIGKLIVESGAGDDVLVVRNGAGRPLTGHSVAPLLVARAGAGANILSFNGSSAAVDASFAASGSLGIVLDKAVVDLSTSQRYTSLALGEGSRVNVLAGGSRVLRLDTLAVDAMGGARLDMADNALILQSTSQSKAANLLSLAGLIRSGRKMGTWSGMGIISSTAAADTEHLTGLALLLNDRGNGSALVSQFAGEAVDANSILVRYTCNGDSDLNGQIDADDYFRIDRGLLRGLSGYVNGDLDYSGVVDADDYRLIDAAFLAQRR